MEIHRRDGADQLDSLQYSTDPDDSFPPLAGTSDRCRRTFDVEKRDGRGGGAPSAFRVQSAVTIQVFHDSDRLGGSWCWRDGPPADYTWSVTSDTLTLAPKGGRDSCGIRGFIWGGQWTRVG
jgi:hypothetical protein